MLNCLFKLWSKKTSIPESLTLRESNPPVTGGFHSQKVSNVLIRWRHNELNYHHFWKYMVNTKNYRKKTGPVPVFYPWLYNKSSRCYICNILTSFLIRCGRGWKPPFHTHVHDQNLYQHDDVIKWKDFPWYWPFVRGIHRSTVNSPYKGQWRGSLMFSLMCARTHDWANAEDLTRHQAHHDVTVMI